MNNETRMFNYVPQQLIVVPSYVAVLQHPPTPYTDKNLGEWEAYWLKRQLKPPRGGVIALLLAGFSAGFGRRLFWIAGQRDAGSQPHIQTHCHSHSHSHQFTHEHFTSTCVVAGFCFFFVPGLVLRSAATAAAPGAAKVSTDDEKCATWEQKSWCWNRILPIRWLLLTTQEPICLPLHLYFLMMYLQVVTWG